jgi:hypothetical protein
MSASPNPNYRVEHVAEAPRGWKVRTKMMSTHMVRIAFPPGARKKGAGKVIEIFHPANENPCAMPSWHARANSGKKNPPSEDQAREMWESMSFADRKNLLHHVGVSQDWAEHERFPGNMPESTRRKILRHLRRRKNPGATDAAAQLYEQFHGASPEKILEMQESDAARHTYTALGDLRELVLDAPAGKVKIGFDGADAVKVASAPGGKQIYLLGGNQNIDSQLGNFGSDPGKDFVELGAAVKITYRARKSMDDFQLVDYWHMLGEETNEPPFAFYDRLKRRIFLVGGRYRVEAPGIIN